jgi:sugar phosphate isomerase/epimerase
MEDQGFSTPQGHLDFQNDLCTRETVENLKREITLFQAIGIKNAVFHINGGLDLPMEKRLEIQENHLRELLEFVAGTDFTFCLENLMSNHTLVDAYRLLAWIHRLGGKNLGICLDTGHLHYARLALHTTVQTHAEFIRKAGSYLKATHIQSNDGSADQHLAPYTGRKNPIDWDAIVDTLRRIGYEGLFNLEIPGETETYPPLPILKAKLTYMKNLLDLMLSEQ